MIIYIVKECKRKGISVNGDMIKIINQYFKEKEEKHTKSMV